MRIYLLFTTVVLFNFISWGQHEIKINFKDRVNNNTIILPNDIKKGEFYQIVVEQFNPNRYSIQIKTRDSVFSTPLEVPTFESFSLDALTSRVSSFNDESAGSTAGPEPTYSQKIQNLKSNKKNIPNDESKPEETLKNLIQFEEKRLLVLTQLLGEQHSLFDALKYDVYTYRINTLKESLSSITFDFDNSQTEATSIRDNTNEISKLATQFKSDYDKVIDKEPISTFLKNNPEIKKQTDNISKTYITLLTKLNEFSGQTSADNVEKLLRSAVFISTESTFRSFPIQYHGELEKLDISFTPKDSTSNLQAENIPTLIFPIKPENEKRYFSVGTSFFYSFLKNQRFSTVLSTAAPDTEATYSVVEEDESNGELGMAVLMRFGKKWYSEKKKNELFGAHWTLGPGITIDEQIRPRLLLGGGISYGEKHNIVIDLGGIAGFVDEKSNAVDISKRFSANPDPTVTKLKLNVFFAIGYMFKL